MAGHQGSLQADDSGRGLGYHPTVFTMVVFSIFFGRLAQMPSDGVPYPIFVYAALVPWTFFAHSLNESSNSLVSSANSIKKVYFPRLAIPISTAVSGLIDFARSSCF